MLGRMISYTYGTVRSRALVTRLLPGDELLELTAADSRSQAQASVERRLNLTEGDLSIDQRLWADYLEFGHILLQTLPGRLPTLFGTYLERPWLENLLVLCRAALGGAERLALPKPPPALADQKVLPHPHEIEDLEDVVRALPEGSYREIILDRLESGEEGELVLLENRLIKAYWESVSSAVARLPGLDLEAARQILGQRADIDALRIVRRGIETAQADEEILASWPPLARLFDRDRLRRILRSERPEDGLQELLERSLGRADEEGRWERALRRRLYLHLRRRLRGPPFDASVPLSALLLKELQVTDLQGLLAGLRYRLDPETLRASLAGWKG